jgi:hypothetical protein
VAVEVDTTAAAVVVQIQTRAVPMLEEEAAAPHTPTLR